MKADVIDKDEDEYERTIKTYEKGKKKRDIRPSITDMLKSLKLRSVYFEKNRINKINNKKNNNTNGNNKYQRRNINCKNKGRTNNRLNRDLNNNGNKSSNINGRKKNNFNSHFVDLDEFLGE